MELTNRARFYARYTGDLFAAERIRARLTSATRGARYLSLGFRLRDPLQLKIALSLAEPLALHTRTAVVVARRGDDRPGEICYQFQLPSGYWQSYTRKDLSGLGVGLGESHRQIDFSFDHAPHALVAGTTDSGKTETVRSILCGLLTTYRPDDLGVVILDPHADYLEDFRRAAHLVAPIAITPDDIHQQLLWCGQELARRRDARQRQARRLVIVIDEAEQALIATPANLPIAQSLASESRKFSMNLIVSTQKPTQTKLPDLVDKLNNRWVGLVDNAHLSALLTGRAGLACHQLTGHGDFVHVIGATVERLQVALATRADVRAIPRAADDPDPIVEVEDTPRLLNFPPSGNGQSQPGRPPTDIDPVKIAYYMHVGPDRVTRTQAEEILGLKRYAHIAHRDWAIEFNAERKRLEAGL